MKKAFPLRISTELWEDIRRLAAADLRSVNAEIEYLLRESVARRLRKRPDDYSSPGDEPTP